MYLRWIAMAKAGVKLQECSRRGMHTCGFLFFVCSTMQIIVKKKAFLNDRATSFDALIYEINKQKYKQT